MDENSITVLIQIDWQTYNFYIDVAEWDGMTGYEKEEFLTDCELEAREQYCAMRTTVKVTRPDGTEEEV